jgi:hypothetical protein
MNKKQIVALLKEWEKTYKELNDQLDLLHNVFPYDECPLENAVFVTFDKYTETLSKLIGDKLEWLFWHMNENDWGKRKFVASVNYQHKPSERSRDYVISSLESLADIIIKTR